MKALQGRYTAAINRTKREVLTQALQAHGSMRKAAAWLGTSPATVCRDCRLLGISLERHVTVRKAS